MDRLYSINSKNGMGYNMISDLELMNEKEYYQYHIKNDESLWIEYILETVPGICDNCKRNLSLDEGNSIKYKLLYPNESLFIFTSRRGDKYCYIYKHYCSDCLNKALYNWSLKNSHNKYPRLRYDGASFIYDLKNMDMDIDNNPKKNYPRIYRCDYNLSSGYNYLDDLNKVYTDNEQNMRKKLISMEISDMDY